MRKIIGAWVFVVTAAGAIAAFGALGSQLYMGGPGGAAWRTMSSDATIANTGAITIASNAITTGKINAAAVTYAKIQNVGASSLLGNPTGSPAAPSEITLGSGLSFSGATLTATGSGGTVTSIVAGTGLTGGTITTTGTIALDLTRANTWTGLGTYSSGLSVSTSFTATGLVTLADLANIGANTYLGNPTSGSAAPSATAISGCSGNNHASQYTTNTGFTCTSDVGNLSVADQTVSGGANVTSLSQSAGNITVDCGARPAQYIANSGAFTVTAPSNDGYCYLDVENGASAGAVSVSGFSPNSIGGATLDTTNGHNFRLVISRVHGHSNIFAVALQ